MLVTAVIIAQIAIDAVAKVLVRAQVRADAEEKLTGP
jgi:hypothetical protein